MPDRLASGGRSIKDPSRTSVLQLQHARSDRSSSNIGTALLTRQLRQADACTTTWSASGSALPPASSCPGSRAGIMPKADMPDGQRDQVAFGQAIAVTGIQEAAAIAGS